MKKTAIILIGLLALTCAMSSFAATDDKGKRGNHFKKMITELNLSNEQIEKFKEFRKSLKGKRKPIRTEVKVLRNEMKSAFISNASDSKLLELHKKLVSARSKMSEMKFSRMLVLKNILDKDQKQKFMELKKSRRANRHNGSGK
jgi:Spy/CpxP family protein refolding chaperone